jgi:hypothetical protein
MEARVTLDRGGELDESDNFAAVHYADEGRQV